MASIANCECLPEGTQFQCWDGSYLGLIKLELQSKGQQIGGISYSQDFPSGLGRSPFEHVVVSRTRTRFRVATFARSLERGTPGETTLGQGENRLLKNCYGSKLADNIWGWVKTLVPSEPQNSWDLWMFIPLKMVSIGIDHGSYDNIDHFDDFHQFSCGPKSLTRSCIEINFCGSCQSLPS
jgi:hypothetical protein